MASKFDTDKGPGFIEVNPDGPQSPSTSEEPMKACEIRICFNNGLVMSCRGGDVEDVESPIRKIQDSDDIEQMNNNEQYII